MSVPLLAATALEKRFADQTAVSGLDLTVDGGEILGLAGRNGAGKTTTLAMLAGVLRPDGGSIRIAGQPFTRRQRSLRGMIGLLPQEAAVYPELSSGENLACFGGLYGLSGAALRRRAGELLDLVGLDRDAERPVAELSGGMRRRLSLAVALLHRPRLLLLDEPTAGVDLEFRPLLLEVVRGQARGGTGVVWAGHDLAGLEPVWDRIVVLESGRPLARTSVSRLLDHHRESAPQAPATLESAVGALLRGHGSS